jgi:hypothetical protein
MISGFNTIKTSQEAAEQIKQDRQNFKNES